MIKYYSVVGVKDRFLYTVLYYTVLNIYELVEVHIKYIYSQQICIVANDTICCHQLATHH